MPPSSLKMMFYSHNTRGLGHAARTLSLIWAIHERMPDASVLWCSGATSNLFPLLPPNADLVKLPSYSATEREGGIDLFPARLQVPIPYIHAMREEILAATARAFRPNVLVVDYMPLGKQKEMETAIRLVRAMPDRLICLGMREIIDDIPTTQKAIRRSFREAILAYFDRVFIYGDTHVFDTIQEYGIPEEINRICAHVGYVVNRHISWGDPAQVRANVGCQESERLVVANFGGGRNAGEIVQKVLLAWKELTSVHVDHEFRLVIVLGPYFDQDQSAAVKAQAAELESVMILDVVPFLVKLINAADLFIGTSSYNLSAELLATETPAVLIPRTSVDSEQMMRAQALEHFGYVTLDPSAEASALVQAVLDLANRQEHRQAVATNGAAQVAAIIEKWAEQVPGTSFF